MTYLQKYWLLLEIVALCVAIILPLSVHAGVFSVFFDTATAESASLESFFASNAQTVPLLKAAIHSDPNPAKGGGDVLIEEGVLAPQGEISGETSSTGSLTSN